MSLTQDCIEEQAFENRRLNTDAPALERLSRYLTDAAADLHRYPEEEYQDVLRALAAASGWPLEGFWIAKTACEALEFLIEALVGANDSVLLDLAHPYAAVIQQQVNIRQGQIIPLDSPLEALVVPKLIFCHTEAPSEVLAAYPKTATVFLNPSQLAPASQAVFLFELTVPSVSLNPLPPVYAFCQDTGFAEVLRRVQEPFHLPTHLLVQMAWAIPQVTFPARVSPVHQDAVQGVLPAIAALQPYIPGKGIKAMARELQMPPSAFCKLASNEHPSGLTAPVLENLQALLNAWKQEAPVYETVSLRLKKRILESVEISGFAPSQVQLGTGSVELIKAILKAFVTPGSLPEKVLFPSMPFAMYPYEVQKRLASAHTVTLEENLQLSLPHFIQEIQATQPQVIFLANPRNPLGTGLLDLDPLIEALTSEQVLILDEAYIDFMRTEVGVDRYPDALALMQRYPEKKIISLRTFSKSHALASFRLGFAIARPDLSQAIADVLLPCQIDPLTLAAGIASLETPGIQAQIEATAQTVAQEKKRIEVSLQGLGLRVVPSYANFLYFETGDCHTSRSLFDTLVRKGLIIRPVLERSVRVSIGLPAENDRFMAAMQQAYLP